MDEFGEHGAEWKEPDTVRCDSIYVTSWGRQNCRKRNQIDQFKQESEWKRTVLPESSFPASPPGAPTLAYQVDSMHFEEGRVLFYTQE